MKPLTSLSSRQIRYLRGLGHRLQPVVMIGEKGLNDNVRAELETALDHHELIKVRLRTDRDSRKSMIAEISELTSAEIVHSIGQVACFFKRNEKKPIIELPKR